MMTPKIIVISSLACRVLLGGALFTNANGAGELTPREAQLTRAMSGAVLVSRSLHGAAINERLKIERLYIAQLDRRLEKIESALLQLDIPANEVPPESPASASLEFSVVYKAIESVTVGYDPASEEFFGLLVDSDAMSNAHADQGLPPPPANRDAINDAGRVSVQLEALVDARKRAVTDSIDSAIEFNAAPYTPSAATIDASAGRIINRLKHDVEQSLKGMKANSRDGVRLINELRQRLRLSRGRLGPQELVPTFQTIARHRNKG